jgi:hypothetical protein
MGLPALAHALKEQAASVAALSRSWGKLNGVAEELTTARQLYGGVAEQLIEAAQIRRAREGR